ncbi:MAG: DEAD/DEAH box helicase, partial [Verrucomicrobia bacterium]|nr:DEAD/DEAH box helicase [Verrucomicrobiota bacterium]
MSSPYHAAYFAQQLTKHCSAHQLEKLSKSIFNATVDLNPHQIEAALFAFRSPLSRGALLADEVGLGKTIEAGLIVSQLWAERKRRILCILPAALRKQWQQELADKFFIESLILESRNFNQLVKNGAPNPFDQRSRIVICSYHFVRSKGADIASVPWDLVVIDEAHRLRNVYKRSNKIARAIRDAVGSCPKVLLTATPLQNSLMELFGLVSFIDPHIFGSEDSFRDLFARRAGDMDEYGYRALRRRISPVCQRTLRKQVTEYIRFTNRVSMTQDFTPTDDEVRLYEAVSAYLQRPDAFALPASQRALMTLVLRKILASSSFAIAATLGALVTRLEALHQSFETTTEGEVVEEVAQDFELTDEMQDEWSENSEEAATQKEQEYPPDEAESR